MARVRSGLRWVCAVEHWTALVLLAVVVVLVGQLIGLVFGVTSVVKSPLGTFEALYQASQDGDYEAAFELLDHEGQDRARSMGAGAWREVVDGLSRGRTIERFQLGSQRLYGENAVIGVLVFHTDGDIRGRVEELVREGTHWRVMWPPGTRSFTETVRKYDPWFGY
ncbi:MAG: hypothetical protein OXE50_09735 [Chloroflexi bacterium]|nr:hypothetical protein [Chloroflexota bacterium]